MQVEFKMRILRSYTAAAAKTTTTLAIAIINIQPEELNNNITIKYN